MKTSRITLTMLIIVTGLALLGWPMAVVLAGTFAPITVTDQTPTAPLANPAPSSFQPRYISGFGSGNSFTVFFEDRDASYAISYASTTSGPTGFPASATATNIADTHFVVKDWPINIGDTDYAYRAWASHGNDLQHEFYVSNDLTNWTLVSTFTIPNALGFTDAHGWVYYGFHDVIQLNGTYYAFAESNQSQTMLVRSANGDDVWEAFASVGGRPGDGPLELPAGVSYGWTPSGSFVDLGHDRGYGKIHVDPRDNNFYLAVNTAAKASLPPADLEAAFINPANWTWHDGTTGPAANPILSATSEHDLRECWVVPNTDTDADWVIIYDADFGSADGGKALGYAALSPPPPPPDIVWVDDDWSSQADVDAVDPSLTWQYDAFSSLQDGVDAVDAGGTVYVRNGTYGVSGQTSECEFGFPTAILIEDLDDLTIQAAPGHEPVVKPVTEVEANIVSITIVNSDHLTIDNIDSDQTIAQFDNWHVCDSDDLTVRNSTFEGGEDGIDFNTDLTTALIENNEFIDINTGSGDEVLDFTDASYSDIVIQDNVFTNNYRQITIYPPAVDTATDFLIRRNIMDGTNSQENVRLISAANITLENNVIMNSLQQGVYIDSGCSSINVWHNSFFNNDLEFAGNGEIRTKVTSSDIVIKNNIFYANGSNPVFETSATSLPGEDYNLVYNYGGSFTFGANTIIGLDPLFVSTTAGSEDLHLQPGSPAIEAGTDLGVTDDIDGDTRPQGVAPDIGADEAPPPDTQGPITSDVVADPNPATVGTGIALTANVDDTTTGNSDIASAEYNIDGGLWTGMSAQDGAFDAVSEDVKATIPAFPEAGVHEICVRGTDVAGNLGDAECIRLSVNAPPSVSAGGPYEGNEGSPISLAGSVDDPDGPSLTTVWGYTPGPDVDADATCEFSDDSLLETTFTCTDDGTYELTLTADDGINPPVQATAVATVDNVAPEVTIAAPPEGDLYQVHTTVDLTAMFTDAGANDTHACQIDWDDSTVEDGTVSELDGTCTGSHEYSSAGVYTIRVTIADDDGGATTASVMVVVYDPEGGFVTGGGWINSPAGAYVADPSLTGKATFGFVSKYKKGAKTPEGNTEFVFKAADLNFHSTSYDWLVVNQAGSNAQFKGSGTINGEGGFRFMLWARDGESDTFRIKIWEEDENSNETVIYDNGFDQSIGGGSIVIHTKKK